MLSRILLCGRCGSLVPPQVAFQLRNVLWCGLMSFVASVAGGFPTTHCIVCCVWTRTAKLRQFLAGRVTSEIIECEHSAWDASPTGLTDVLR